MEKHQGLVVSGYGGFYQVRLPQGQIVNCKPRGRLKKEFSKIYVGDRVAISLLADGSGMIEEIHQRRHFLPRPNIVNTDQLLIVLAWQMPAYDLLLLDRMLVIAQKAGIRPLICFNKIDLLGDDFEQYQKIAATYMRAGFSVFAVSATENAGMDELRAALSHGTTVMAGQSGVGKSSLLNRLIPEENAEVGAVSERLRRGRHTTRYNRMLQLPGSEDSFITDTPGFFIIELPADFTAEELAGYYPEFTVALPCRFEGCLHKHEPDCGVKEAVVAGEIDVERYQRYLRLLAEIQGREVQYR